MKTQKTMSVLATLALLSFAVACNDGGGGTTTAAVSDRYQEGFAAGKVEGKKEGYAEGYDKGYDDGYLDGDEAGFERAKVFFASSDYNAGFADGKASVASNTTAAYNSGYSAGKTDGVALGKAQGYDLGYDDGYADGYDGGYDDGMADGYDMGYDDGIADGYDLGYDDGFDDGYDIGYDDGFDDGFHLSVGPTPKLRGYANILSMAHNDLIDYSKIKAPKITARGVVAGGRLLFSETSLTNKDTLKRAAAVEQYLVVEMAKQVKGKFGLSADRSLKVAKAANHFRKYSSKRALTAEDTNAYFEEIAGVDLKSMEKAVENSMKGDLSSLNSVLEKAASKNEVSPEKMSEIVTELFI